MIFTNEPTYLAVFFAGILSSLSPCMLGVGSLLASRTATNGRTGNHTGARGNSGRIRTVTLSAIFVVGMSSALGILGGLAATFGGRLAHLGPLWNNVGAIVFLAAGIYLFLSVPAPLQSLRQVISGRRFFRFRPPVQITGFYHKSAPRIHLVPNPLVTGTVAFGSGALFGFTLSPCSTPMALAILTALMPTTPLRAASFLFTFEIGHGMILLVIAALGNLHVPCTRHPAWS